MVGMGTVVSSAEGVTVGIGGRGAEDVVESKVEDDSVVDEGVVVGVLVGNADNVVRTVSVMGAVAGSWGAIGSGCLGRGSVKFERRGRVLVK